jgi:DNA-binding transcriptional MerR regulator
MALAPAQEATSKRRSGKSASAFRTISEVAKELDLPQHVLRFWESKFPQIKPVKRGGGRRYYRPEDLVMLRHIRDLLYNDGYTIKGVQKLLKENGGKIEVAAAPTSGEATTLSADKSAALKSILTELEDIQKLLS